MAIIESSSMRAVPFPEKYGQHSFWIASTNVGDVEKGYQILETNLTYRPDFMNIIKQFHLNDKRVSQIVRRNVKKIINLRDLPDDLTSRKYLAEIIWPLADFQLSRTSSPVPRNPENKKSPEDIYYQVLWTQTEPRLLDYLFSQGALTSEDAYFKNGRQGVPMMITNLISQGRYKEAAKYAIQSGGADQMWHQSEGRKWFSSPGIIKVFQDYGIIVPTWSLSPQHVYLSTS